MLYNLISSSSLWYFVYLYRDVLIFNHLPTIVVFDSKYLSNIIFSSVFEDKRISNIFGCLVGAIHIEQIVR